MSGDEYVPMTNADSGTRFLELAWIFQMFTLTTESCSVSSAPHPPYQNFATISQELSEKRGTVTQIGNANVLN